MRTLTLMTASLLLAACSTPEQHLVGGDRDSHDCIGSAGYQWSALTNQCVRLFEQAVRLQSLEANETGSAFLLFNADQSQAELTLPNGEQTLLTRQGDEATGPGRAVPINFSSGRVICSNPASRHCFTATAPSDCQPMPMSSQRPGSCRGVFYGWPQCWRSGVAVWVSGSCIPRLYARGSPKTNTPLQATGCFVQAARQASG